MEQTQDNMEKTRAAVGVLVTALQKIMASRLEKLGYRFEDDEEKGRFMEKHMKVENHPDGSEMWLEKDGERTLFISFRMTTATSETFEGKAKTSLKISSDEQPDLIL